MIRVPRVPAPQEYEAVRQAGAKWLREHSEGDPPDRWSRFRPVLEEGFGSRCGYTAMYTDPGQVDHFKCQRDHRPLAYEWTNYRFCSGSINSRKGCKDVLDPHEVGEGWFELHHPSLQLQLTAVVPANKRAIAQRTIHELGLRDGEAILKTRQRWLRMFLKETLTLVGLQRMAPLVADMVERNGLVPGG